MKSEDISRTELVEKISTIIADILENECVIFQEEDNLIDGIGLDSMGFLELAIQIQRNFGILIPSEEWKDIITIGDLTNKIYSKLDENI